jgi:lactoylglutathione lyase
MVNLYKPLHQIILPILIVLSMAHIMDAQTRINHTAIYVTDVQKSGDFYQRIIGLIRIADPFNDDRHMWLRTSPTTSLHIIGTSENTKEYFKDHHTCYSVADFDGTIALMQREGVAFEDVNGNAGKYSTRKDGVRQIYLKDPDGYWLEINDEK